MTTLNVQHTIDSSNGLPADAVVNTWHFTTINPVTNAIADSIFDALVAFYQVIDQYYAATLNTSAHLKAYDRSDPSPRQPIRTRDYALVLGATSLPQEVALCMSYQATRVSGQLQSRRRGRVYLGPFAVTAASDSVPSAALLTAIKTAAQGLLTTSTANANWTWVQFSETDQAEHDVVDGWIDNAFDTMRSRGRRPTVRTLFP
jgi:hypothetical protein